MPVAPQEEIHTGQLTQEEVERVDRALRILESTPQPLQQEEWDQAHNVLVTLGARVLPYAITRMTEENAPLVTQFMCDVAQPKDYRVVLDALCSSIYLTTTSEYPLFAGGMMLYIVQAIKERDPNDPKLQEIATNLIILLQQHTIFTSQAHLLGVLLAVRACDTLQSKQFFSEMSSTPYARYEKLFAQPITDEIGVRKKLFRADLYKGKMDEGRFTTLMQLDFDDWCREHPVIEPGFSLDAALRYIEKLPPDRQDAFREYVYEMDMQQKLALGQCRVFIARYIAFNPDLSKEKLMGVVQMFAQAYAFTKENMQSAEEAIDLYLTYREKSQWAVRTFATNRSLVQYLTGYTLGPTENVEISLGLMEIDILADGTLTQRLSAAVEKIDTGRPTNFAFEKGGVRYTVIIKQPGQESSLAHEHQHGENNLSQQVFYKQFLLDALNVELAVLYRVYRAEPNAEKKAQTLMRYFALKKQWACLQFADELFAMKKDRDPYRNIAESVFFNEETSYDYLAGHRDELGPLGEDDDQWNAMREQVLVREYRRDVVLAIEAFERMERGGMTREEIIALLIDQPVASWPELARRALRPKPVKVAA